MNQTNRYRFLIEVLLFLSYFTFGVSWIGYSPFLNSIQTEYGLNHASAGLVISSVSFAKIFIPLVSSILAVRIGVSKTILLGMLCICASALTPFAPTFSTLLLTRIVFGMGGAVVITLLGSAILQWFPKKELPIVNGFNYVAVNSGITLSLFITPQLAQSVGRTLTLSIYAGVSVVIALVWFFFGKDRETAGWPQQTDVQKITFAQYQEILKRKEVWWLTLAAAGPLSLYLVFNTWLPTYYQQRFGMSIIAASRLTGLSNMVGIPAAILGGFLTQRMTKRKPLILFSGALVGVSAFGLFMTPNVLLLEICAVLFGIGLFLWLSPLSTIAMELPGITPKKLAILNGIFYGIGYLIAFIAPVMTGAIKDHSGSFLPGFVFFALFAWSLFLAGIFLPETGGRLTSANATA